jgi:hypothetical protein
MRHRYSRDTVDMIAAVVAGMALRECTFVDRLWFKRQPTGHQGVVKLRHTQFMAELIAFYCCACEDFLESVFLFKVEPFMNLVADQAALAATHDQFIATPPYFESDLVEHRRKRYEQRIRESRSKLRLIPSHLRIEWTAARTALALRQIISHHLDDRNELSRIECRLAERLEWTAAELTGSALESRSII